MNSVAEAGAKVATLRIGGGAVGFNWLPVIVADRQGMFARRNLAIEIKRLGAVDKATAAVKNGELDLVITPPRERSAIAPAAAIFGSSPAMSIACRFR